MRTILTAALALVSACSGSGESPGVMAAEVPLQSRPIGAAERAAAIDAASQYRRQWLRDTVALDFCSVVEILGGEADSLRLLPPGTRSLVTAPQLTCDAAVPRHAPAGIMMIDSIGGTDSTIALETVVTIGDNSRRETFTIVRERMVVGEHRLRGFMNLVQPPPR